MAEQHHKRPHLYGVDRSVDIADQRFGRLIALKRTGRDKNRAALWLCRCDCGVEREFKANSLRRGSSTSCGCKRRETTTTHGRSHTAVYRVWKAMMARCYNPKNISYARYGGRGIAVCESWHRFESFAAEMGDPPLGMSLEREKANGNYEPGNTRWATPTEQARNRRSGLMIEYEGATRSLAEWAAVLGLNYTTVWHRLRVAGWSIDKAFARG